MTPDRLHMTRDEVTAQISADHDLTTTQVGQVFDALTDLGVDLDRLVRMDSRQPYAHDGIIVYRRTRSGRFEPIGQMFTDALAARVTGALNRKAR